MEKPFPPRNKQPEPPRFKEQGNDTVDLPRPAKKEEAEDFVYDKSLKQDWAETALFKQVIREIESSDDEK